MFAGEFRVLWPQLISYSFFHRPVKSAINEKPEPNSTINKKKKKLCQGRICWSPFIRFQRLQTLANVFFFQFETLR